MTELEASNMIFRDEHITEAVSVSGIPMLLIFRTPQIIMESTFILISPVKGKISNSAYVVCPLSLTQGQPLKDKWGASYNAI